MRVGVSVWWAVHLRGLFGCVFSGYETFKCVCVCERRLEMNSRESRRIEKNGNDSVVRPMLLSLTRLARSRPARFLLHARFN